MKIERFVLRINRRNFAATQYLQFDFNAVAVIDGLEIAANEDGLFTLGDSDFADGAQIDAYFDTPPLDFGSPRRKRATDIRYGMRRTDDMRLTVTVDDGQPEVHDFPRFHPSDHDRRMEIKVPVAKSLGGRYHRYRTSNVRGGNFAVDEMHAAVRFFRPGEFGR